MKVHAQSLDRAKSDLDTIYQAHHRCERYYRLVILAKGLKQLHQAVEESALLVRKYLEEFDGRWLYFATAHRAVSIAGYGSDDEDDYNADGSVRYTEDPGKLSTYTLYDQLSHYIGGNYHEQGANCQVRGEGIGSSSVEDFADLISLVKHESEFSVTKFFAAQHKPLTIYREDEQGQLVPISLADQIEAELNDDIRNTHIANTFTRVLQAGSIVRSLFEILDPFSDHTGQYANLLTFIENIRDVRL